jgi:ParB-like chromosome segregation protein Spo0J
MELEFVDEQYSLQGEDHGDEESSWSYLALSLGVGDDPLTEARHIDRLLKLGYTQKEIAKRIRKKQPLVSKRNMLNFLLPELQQMIADGKMSATAGYRIGGLPHELQRQLLDTEYVSIDEAELLVKKEKATRSGKIEREQPVVIPDGFFDVALPGISLSADQIEYILVNGPQQVQWNGDVLWISLES